MEFIDTHAHLYTEEFDADRLEVLERAREVGVTRMILPAIDSKSHQAMIEMAKAHPTELYPLIGLHPTSVKDDYIQELAVVENYLSERSFFHGIGEIGIDLYWDKTHYKQQVDAFKKQVNWAKELKLPIVIHTRDSFNEVYQILEPMVNDDLTGIFHCFGGTVEEAEKITAMGFKLGIGGVLTFKNSKLDEVIHQIDINHIVLETDSPYLAPVPFRGKRNESSYLIRVAEKLAGVYNLSVKEVAQITTKNALRVFQI
jgi:TatD DNase family protein